MSETRFTPGPWKVGYLFSDVGVESCPTIGGYHKLFDVRGWGYLTGGGALRMNEVEAYQTQSANAYLISAAPELYEALSCLVDEGEILSKPLLEKALAALAKARGEV